MSDTPMPNSINIEGAMLLQVRKAYEQLERELAAVTAERDEFKHEVAFRRDDSVALADARERIRSLEMDLAEKQRPLDAEMARLNANLIEANEAALISGMERDRMRPVVEAAFRYANDDSNDDTRTLNILLNAVDTYEAATCPSATETP